MFDLLRITPARQASRTASGDKQAAKPPIRELTVSDTRYGSLDQLANRVQPVEQYTKPQESYTKAVRDQSDHRIHTC